MDPSAIGADELISWTRAAADDAGIRPDRWEAFLGVIAPLRTHAETMFRHSLRVGLYAYGLAVDEGADAKFALHAGCGHDLGKCFVDPAVLNAVDFGAAERAAVQVHPNAGFEMLAPTNMFTAFVAGTHHLFQEHGYGIDLDEVSPWPLSPETRAVILRHAELVAVVDFYDAASTRTDRTGVVPTRVDAARMLYTRFGNTPRTRWIAGHHLDDLRDADLSATSGTAR